MRNIVFAVSAFASLAIGPAAFAADNRWCSGVSETSDSADLKLARVTAKGPRINFVSNPGDTDKTKACPSNGPECRRNGFVVPGDAVLVDAIEGDFACVSYVSTRAAETGGWLPKSALTIEAQQEPKSADWAGEWKRVEATINLKVSGAMIEADGDATWGAHDPRRVKSGGVNIGEFSGKAQPQGNMLAFGEGYSGKAAPDEDKAECLVRLRLFGPYLVSEDNRKCGGMNVSFTGVFVRANAATRKR